MIYPQSVLKQYFGYDAFRPGQGEVVDRLLRGEDVLSVMPTGAGKSICYQVPALCMPGITLVVSPLISLMQDQVRGLIQVGVPAAYLNSSLTERQFYLALRNARMGKYKIIYVAPERLETAAFLAFAAEANISMVAVDEAHCVSQWGQDFRPSYLAIPDFVACLPRRPVVGAFTATATPEVREDIVGRLALQSPFTLVSGFDRANLYWEVQSPKSKREALLQFLARRREDSGIVYCATRKNVEEVCSFLRASGFGAVRYHAGLEPEERRENQERFVHGDGQIMVATNAFGMGIDKPDVRYVVHYNMPKDLESYYQEAGRAGRDGDPAHCLLLFSRGDIRTNQYLIELQGEETGVSEEDRARRIKGDKMRLRQMASYCETANCLRRTILRYFGEPARGDCGNCGNCTGHFQLEDVSADARRILFCVQESGQRFGVMAVADILRGVHNERSQRWYLDDLDSFGALAGQSQEKVLRRIRLLVEEDCLVQSEGQYPILSLGPGAGAVMRGERAVTLRVRAKETKPAPAQATMGEGSEELYARLQQLRTRLAQRAGVPAYVIFSNQTLREMCQRLPRDEGELLRVSGVGSQKLSRFGKEFLAVIREWREEQSKKT